MNSITVSEVPLPDPQKVRAIAQALSDIDQQIDTYKQVETVTLVAASKYTDATGIMTAVEAGIKVLGENKVLEGIQKQQQIKTCVETKHWALPEGVSNLRWDFIGHLQSNKANKCVGAFELIHSVDDMTLLEKISKRAQSMGMVQPILLQVNVMEEATKSGFTVSSLQGIYPQVRDLEGVKPMGLMAMAPLGAETSELDQCFGGLAKLRDKLAGQYGDNLEHLSMGMSQDYVHALRSGATILRIGSQIFNPVIG